MVSDKFCKKNNIPSDKCRKELVKKSREKVPNLDKNLTAYCPSESLHISNLNEIKDYKKNVLSRRKQENIDGILLVACSSKKPYSESQSHKDLFKKIGIPNNKGIINIDNKRVKIVVVSSALGIVPYEDVISNKYPTNHYDSPSLSDQNKSCLWIDKTTKEQSKDKKKVFDILGKDLGKWLKKNGNGIPILSVTNNQIHSEIVKNSKKECVECNFKENILKQITLEERTSEIMNKGNSSTNYKPFKNLTKADLISLVKKRKGKPDTLKKKISRIEELDRKGKLIIAKRERAKGSAFVGKSIKPFNTDLLLPKIKKNLKR